MNPREFVEAFRNAVAEQGWRRVRTPGEVVDRWQQVVGFVEMGYNDNTYELHNDLSIRTLIERLLHDERLRRFEELGWFREQVEELDQRLRELLQPDPIPGSQRPWWLSHAPRYGGPDLVADFKDVYGVTIEELPAQ